MSISQLSRFLYWALLLVIVGMALMWLYFLASADSFLAIAQKNAPFGIQWESVENWQLRLSCLVVSLPSVLFAWGLFNLRRTFLAFSKHQYFELNNVTYVKRFALALAVSAPLHMFAVAVASVLLSLNHPDGQKVLSITFGSHHVLIFFTGLVFWLISKILIQAHLIAQENKEFV